ncbi:serine/threonine protein kinase [Halobacillus sp. ACCC02827]|uniref:hypothetical protein n=1 Tax=Bacillaceae TaxID=186817 RepID=UPI0002A521AA|nr:MULTISPECIES: hypothetical protein [Bacillaceae]ELK47015.1 hypothetical protein D479_08611 [Halobacillus sp. BAB-2008]WJE17705.1 serine/threonine protein kinase [Halobacillus sp. ACCC02827]
MKIEDKVREVVFENGRITNIPEGFRCVGQGRSAAVFHVQDSNTAVKVFYPEFAELAEVEAEVYESLNNSEMFPLFISQGKGYLVMEYLEGMTFYDCLVSGVPITAEMVKQVEEALLFACSLGLNPSDIHLKNMLLTSSGKVKVIDVVRFKQEQDCPHWRDLKKAYETYYVKPYMPKKLPRFFIECIIRLYRRRLLPI